jgi:hypothetical protein
MISNKIKYLAILATVAVVVVFLIPVTVVFEHNPLPSASKIESIKYSYRRYNKKIDIEGIIHPEQYDEFISLFNDSRKDFNPAKWQVAGGCLIKVKNGQSIEIDLFSTSVEDEHTKSAMRIGRTYYRVSTDKDFQIFFQRNKNDHLPSGTEANGVTP